MHCHSASSLNLSCCFEDVNFGPLCIPFVICDRGTFRPAGIQVALHRVKHITWRPSEPEMFYVQCE